MSKKISIRVLDPRSIQKAITDLEAYKRDILEKADRLCDELVARGATIVSLSYARVNPFVSDKPTDYEISVYRKDNHFIIRAEGDDVLFLEFGSGSRYGYGHPAPGAYGPGTYPGKGHWKDPQGWFTPKGQHAYGNPPSAGMYLAREEMEDRALEIAQRIFNG